MLRRTLLCCTLLTPLPAHAQIGLPGGFGQITLPTAGGPQCPRGTTFNDLCPASPVAQTTISPATVFSGYAARPPWNVPCVDYACGQTTATGSLLDPTTASLPSGAVYSAGAHTVTVNSANVTIAGYDFGLHNGTTLVCNAANLTVRNNHFLVGSNAGALGNVMRSTSLCSAMSIISNEVDGASIPVTTQQGQTLNFIDNGGGIWTIKYNYMHNTGGDVINWGSNHSIVTLVYANFFKDVGSSNTDHVDTIQFYDQTVGVGSRYSFNYVWQTVDQPGSGNGLFVQLSEGPNMSMGSLDVSNNGVASLAACVSCNWLVGFYDDLGATSQNVSVRNNYADPTGVDQFTQSPWFATGKVGADLAHPFLLHDLTNMVTGALLPIYSASSPGPQGYYVYPDNSGYTPSLSDIFTITASPSTGTLTAGQSVVFTVNMAVLPWTVTGTPTLTLNCSGCVANYTAGSGTNTLTFTYTVKPADVVNNLAIVAINP